MKSKTVKALRALAKQRGLKGYSKLSKEELLRRLDATALNPQPPSAVATEALKQPETPRPVPGQEEKTHASEPIAPAAALDEATRGHAGRSWWEPARAIGPAPAHFASEEERVEGAKYALAPSGPVGAPATTDLGEDIDRLPALREPVLCLLPQKPGVLHAYWVLPDGARAGRDLKLRLCRGERERLEVWEELPLPSEQGTWYFHVPETLHNHDVVLQLGYYREGEFVSAIRRGAARIPSLYASASTDRWWWIAEEDFRRLYLQAGGFEAGGRRYGWAAAVGSPGAPPPGPGAERLAWPGGVSSR